MANALRWRWRPRNLNQAITWLVAAITVPLLLGALIQIVDQARHEAQVADEHLATLAQALVHAVDRELDYGRGQLEVIAVSPMIDAGDWQQLQNFSAQIASRRSGSHIVLVRPDGQLLMNTGVPWGQPLPNIWSHGDDNRQVPWQGRTVPLRWRNVAQRVFEGRTVYSDLYFGGTTKAPTLALSVPVVRHGQVPYGLTLVFPPAVLRHLVESAVDTTGVRAVVVDRLGLVVASNAASSAHLADRVSPINMAPGATAGHYEASALDGTPLRGAYAVSPTNGFVVRVAMPKSQLFAPARAASAGWLALVMATLAISAVMAKLLGRRLAEPLKELSRFACQGKPPADISPTGVAEIDTLAQALRLGAEAERQRVDEHILRVMAQQQEALVAASEDRLTRVLDQLFVFVSVLDLDGKLLQCNSAPLEQAGIRAGEVTGKLFWECYWWQHDGAETDRVREAARRAAQGETVRFDTVARFDGNTLQTVDLQMSPLRDHDGRITNLIASGVNVESRVLALHQLEQSEAKADSDRRLLEATLDAAPVGITLADPNGQVLRLNAAGSELSGIGSTGERSLYVSHECDCIGACQERPEPLEMDEWPLQVALREQIRVSRVLDIRWSEDSAKHTVLMSAAPVLDAKGNLIGGVMVEVDITERMRATAALRRADRQKDEFLATLSHELRNPLGPIRNAAELIRMTDPQDARVQRARGIIERQVSHLARLVDDLLDVSRITLGTITLSQARLDLGALAISAAESVRSTVEGARLTLEQEIEEPHVFVNGDATRLLQCILNLLNNAVKFTPAGGRIVMRVAKEDVLAVVEIIDSGSGISPAHLERIFELFAQEHPSGFNGNTGLGIGLALTRKLVGLHGGFVRATSAGRGCGSTFRIELPAVSAPAEEQRPIAVQSDGTGTRVLVVDDNRDAADLLGELLSLKGFNVTSVYGGEEALRVVKRNEHDAVLLDIGLPDVDGYEVCRRIGYLGLSRPPLLIALTGWGQEKDRAMASAAGFHAHLTKPADPDRIVALLTELIQRPATGISSAPQPFAIPVKGAAPPMPA